MSQILNFGDGKEGEGEGWGRGGKGKRKRGMREGRKGGQATKGSGWETAETTNGTKIVYVFQQVNGDVAFKNFTTRKPDARTKQKTKTNIKLFVSQRRAKFGPTKLDMMIEEIGTNFAHQKLFRIRPIVSPLRSAENLGEYAPRG